MSSAASRRSRRRRTVLYGKVGAPLDAPFVGSVKCVAATDHRVYLLYERAQCHEVWVASAALE